MRILFFGTYDLEDQPRVRVLEAGLAELGHEVAECNVSLGFDTRDRIRAARQPFRAPVLAARIATAWAKLWWRARKLRSPDVVVVPHMGQFDVHLARRIWRRTPLALDQYLFLGDTAADRGVSSRILLRALDRIDRAAVAAADLVFVDTEGHRGLLPESVTAASVVVPVGAPSGWFREPQRRDGGPVSVIFFGIYTPLQGAPVIGEAIHLLSADRGRVRFTMVGRGQDFEETRARAGASPNVSWIDWLDVAELANLVGDHDVCLGIFGTGAKALRVVPNKVFQGAAAGCAIVTSDSPPQREALDGAAVFVPPGDAVSLADALQSLADDRERVWAQRQAAYARALEAFRPAAVVRPLHERLQAGIGLRAR